MELMPGYKQSDAGSIPEDWLDHKVGDYITFVGGSQPNKSTFSSALRPGYVRLIQIRDYKSDRFETFVPVGLVRRFCDEQDIMIGRYGPPVFQILKGLSGAYNVALIKTILRPGINREFVYHFLKQERLFAFIERLSRRSSGQTGVDLKELRAYPFPLPPETQEQDAVADALSDADALIESLEQLLVKKRHIKQGAMQQLLTGKMRLPGFTGVWSDTKIAEIAFPSNERNQDGQELPVLTCSKHVGFVDSLRFFKNQVFSDDTSSYKLIRRGQIGYPANHIEEGSIGLQDLYDAAIVSPIYVIFSVRDNVNSFFLHRLLKLDSFRQTFAVSTASSVDRRGSLRWPAFSEINVNLPTREEQDYISAVLTEMEAEIEALDEKLAKARQLKQGMMEELLTGRIRLVRPSAQILSFPAKESAVANNTSHNKHFNEAVVIAVLSAKFGSETFPLGRFRRTKFAYLLHQHVEREAAGFMKKAAGPYNPSTRYGGAEKIALQNRYVRIVHAEKGEGFVAGEKIAQAEGYFAKWYGTEALTWLDQFRYQKKDALELLTTVDMACEDLSREGKVVTLSAVKQIIHDSPEWKAKLNRSVFSDDNIAKTIQTCGQLFPVE